jgi:hypothetical protein
VEYTAATSWRRVWVSGVGCRVPGVGRWKTSWRWVVGIGVVERKPARRVAKDYLDEGRLGFYPGLLTRVPTPTLIRFTINHTIYLQMNPFSQEEENRLNTCPLCSRVEI